MVWMLYMVAVSAVVGLAATALEHAALAVRRPVRWIWVAAFAAALVAALAPGPTWSGSAVGDLAEGFVGGVATETVADARWAAPGEGGASGAPEQPAAAGDPTDRWLAFLWLACSGTLFLGWWVAVLWMLHRTRRWPRVRLPEGRVFVSHDTGPAVVGAFRGRIVLPRWCLRLDEGERDLVLAHEREHVRARDGLVVTCATLLALAVPWNVPFWLYLRRLRLAVELDCDARVMARHPDAGLRYGELLIRVASRGFGPGVALASFSKESSNLARRIRMLIPSGSISRARAGLLVAGGGLLLIVACLVPGPDRDVADATGPESEASTTEAPADLAAHPVFTPREVEPKFRDRRDFLAALQAEYTRSLRAEGASGTVELYLFVDEEGVVRNTEIAESSGRAELDEAASRAVTRARFEPAMNRGEPVPVWIVMPVRFDSQGPVLNTSDTRRDRSSSGERSSLRERSAEGARQLVEGSSAQERAPADRPPPPESTGDFEDAPVFTPRDIEPELRDVEEAHELLDANFPEALRDAGVGGTVELYLLVDEHGEVRNTELSQSSGRAELDDAASRAAMQMSFVPAENRGEAVPVWIVMPVSFQAR